MARVVETLGSVDFELDDGGTEGSRRSVEANSDAALATLTAGNVTLSNIASNTGDTETIASAIETDTTSINSTLGNIETLSDTTANSASAIALALYNNGDPYASFSGFVPHYNDDGTARAASVANPLPVAIYAAAAPVVKNASITRPANITAYDTGDLLSADAAATHKMREIVSAVRTNGGHARLTSIKVGKSSNTILNASLLIHFFRYTAVPDFPADNAPADFGISLVSPTFLRLGQVELAFVSAGNSNMAFSIVDGLQLEVFAGAANTSIGWVVTWGQGYVPTSGEEFHFEFTLEQS